jgi:ribosomal protein S18 acetylase RimI-like enzyme
MWIEKTEEVTDELLDALDRLVPQLTDKNPPPSRTELTALVKSESSTLLLARVPDAGGPIAGMLTLIVYRTPTGIRSRIEDVVVDSSMRGQGIGEALVRRALELARAAGAPVVFLTSSSRREAANRLYQRLGFERGVTNSYYFKL